MRVDTPYEVRMLSHMKRFEILFPVQMLLWLRSESKRRGVGIGEIIRTLIQQAMDKK
jgi:hypothetical protein